MTSLSALEQDALTEMFNIGFGAAAAALQALSGEHVPLSVPEVQFTRLADAEQQFLAREHHALCTVRQTYSGDFGMDAVLLFPQEHRRAVTLLMAAGYATPDMMDDLEQDALGELGNIVLNAVMASMATGLGIELTMTLPEVQLVSAHEFFTHQGPGDAVALVLLVEFTFGHNEIPGYLALLPDAVSRDALLRRVAAQFDAPSSD